MTWGRDLGFDLPGLFDPREKLSAGIGLAFVRERNVARSGGRGCFRP